MTGAGIVHLPLIWFVWSIWFLSFDAGQLDKRDEPNKPVHPPSDRPHHTAIRRQTSDTEDNVPDEPS